MTVSKSYLIIFALLLCSQNAYTKNIGCGFSYIPESQLQSGCSCNYFVSRNNQTHFIFQSAINFEAPKMYIKDELIDLETVDIQAMPASPIIGDQFTQLYQFEGHEMMFFNTVTATCDQNDAACATTTFSSSVTLKRGGCVIRLNNISGDCGC